MRRSNHGGSKYWLWPNIFCYERTDIVCFGFSSLSTNSDSVRSGVYCTVVLSHAVLCCLGTRILARLQTVYVFLNVVYVQSSLLRSRNETLTRIREPRLCLAVIVALPAATPKEFRNTASFALGGFSNGSWSILCLFLAPGFDKRYSKRLAEWFRLHPEFLVAAVDNM